SYHDVLLDALRARRLLLVLDNCEHLVGACAELAYDLLRACPEPSILTTSREPLRVIGETVWRVPSLARPDATAVDLGRVWEFESVRLFAERAKAACTDFRISNAGVP